MTILFYSNRLLLFRIDPIFSVSHFSRVLSQASPNASQSTPVIQLFSTQFSFNPIHKFPLCQFNFHWKCLSLPRIYLFIHLIHIKRWIMTNDTATINWQLSNRSSQKNSSIMHSVVPFSYPILSFMNKRAWEIITIESSQQH